VIPVAVPSHIGVTSLPYRPVKISTILLLAGAVLFVLPVPGTFVAGALTLLAGGIARWLSS